MFAIENVLIGDELVENNFVCNLQKCKGDCCQDGDAGAPLEKLELALIDKHFETIKPYLSKNAISEIEVKGKYVYSNEFGWVTPTLENDHEICVYGKRNISGIITCAFEQAYNEGKINFKKPISCHLFPLIIEYIEPAGYLTLNYLPREVLCKPACTLGNQSNVPLYIFLKEPIIRKFGEDFFLALDELAKINRK